MAENQDWDLKEEPKQQEGAPVAAGEEPASVEVAETPPASGAKSSLPRVLLLLLLLVGLGAAAFYYFAAVPQNPAPATAVKPQRQPIPIPIPVPTQVPAAPKPLETPESQQAAAAPVLKEKAAAVVRSGKNSGSLSSNRDAEALKVSAQVPRGVLKEVLPEDEPAAPVTKEVMETPSLRASIEKTVPVAAAKTSTVPLKRPIAVEPAKKMPVESPLAAVPVGHYMVEVGVYLEKVHFEEARLSLEQLGYEPRAVEIEKEMEMTRLWVGAFAPDEARRRHSELKAIAPDAFLLPDGDQLAVYAGSYHDLDQARSWSDKLYRHNVQVTEQQAMVMVSLTRLNFGDYASLAEARKAAERVRAAGLSTYVLKKR